MIGFLLQDRRSRAPGALVLGLAALVAYAQEQKYRERQVLDPQSNQWVDQERPPEEAPGDELAQARQLLADHRPGQARALLKKWLKSNADDERAPEANFLLGETYFESRHFWKAAERYQSVAEEAAGELFQLANGRCVDVGRAFMSGQKRIVWGFLRLPAAKDGVDLLDRVWERAPGTRLGELALKYKADYYFDRGDMDLAQDEYTNLAQQYPSGRFIQFAQLRSAEASEAAFPGIRFDDQPLLEAEEKYRQFRGTFPLYAEREDVATRLAGIRQKRADKDLDIARWYERTRRPDAASYYYQQILKDWPGTLAESEARARLRALGVDVPEPAPSAASEGGHP